MDRALQDPPHVDAARLGRQLEELGGIGHNAKTQALLGDIEDALYRPRRAPALLHFPDKRDTRGMIEGGHINPE